MECIRILRVKSRVAVVPCTLISIVMLLTLSCATFLQWVGPTASGVQFHFTMGDVEGTCSTQQRLALLGETCQKSRPSYTPADLQIPIGRLLVIDSLQLIFCPVPKAASTSWKDFFVQLSDHHPPLTNESQQKQTQTFSFLESHGITRLSQYSAMEIKTRLRNYFKMMVVRHPFDRLLSAYRKIMLQDTWHKPHLRPYIIDCYRHGIRNKSMDYYIRMFRDLDQEARNYLPPFNNESRYMVRFSEFLQYAVDALSSNISVFPDIHIMSQDFLCQPCSIQYDYVGKTETMVHDIQQLQKTKAIPKLRAHLRVVYSSGYNKTPQSEERQTNAGNVSRVIPPGYDQNWTSISASRPELIDKLLVLYKKDLERFGYSWNLQTQSHRCGSYKHCC